MSVDTGTGLARQSESSTPFFVSLDEVGAHTFPSPPEGDRRWTASTVVRDYFGQPTSVRDKLAFVPGPQAFLVEVFPPQTTAGAHFHDSNQFQIFYPAGGAYYKRRPIDGTLLHYADAYSTYGPFGAHENPMTFHTLRQTAATITAYMPQDRDKLIRQSGRNLTVDVSISDSVQGLQAVDVETLIETADDGLAAYSVSGGPSATITLPSAVGSGGQYVCVVAGVLVFQGKEYPVRSVGWVPPGSSGVDVVTGESGAQALILQFPRSA